MFDALIPYDRSQTLPMLLAAESSPFIVTREPWLNMDARVVLDTGKVRRFRLLAVESQGVEHELRPEAMDWIQTEPPGRQSFLLFRSAVAGRFQVTFALDHGETIARHEATIVVQDIQAVRGGVWIGAAASQSYACFAARSFIEVLCRETGRHLGFIPAGAGQWFVAISILGEERLLGASQDGFLHSWSFKDGQRSTYRLTMLPTPQARLIPEEDGTFFFHVSSSRCWRLRFGADGTLENLGLAPLPPSEGEESNLDRVMREAATQMNKKIVRYPPREGESPEYGVYSTVDAASVSMTGGGGVSRSRPTAAIAASNGLRISGTYRFASQETVYWGQEDEAAPTAFRINEPLSLSDMGTALFVADGNRDSIYAVAGSNGRISLFNTHGGQYAFQAHGVNSECKTAASREEVSSANCFPFFLPTGELVSGGMDNHLKLYRINSETLKPSQIWDKELPGNPQDLAMHPGGLLVTTPLTLLLLDLSDASTLATVNFNLHFNYLDAVAWVDEAEKILVGDWGGTLHVLDQELQKEEIFEVSDHSIFKIIALNQSVAWVFTESQEAILVNWREQVILGKLAPFSIPYGRRHAMQLSIGYPQRSGLLYWGDPKYVNIRPVSFYPFENITAENGQIYLTPLNRVWGGYPALLDAKTAL